MEKVKARRQRVMRMWQIAGVVLVILVVAGLGFGLFQLLSGGFEISLFSTPTPTPTFTPTPVLPTATLYLSPTPTLTPSVTPSPTRSGPITHAVEEAENLIYIAGLYEVSLADLVAFNLENGIDLTTGELAIGQEILIPPPDYEVEIPTSTPIPEDLFPGALIDYTVQPGDLLSLIAEEFNTTVDAILEANEGLDNPDELNVGETIQIPYNLITLTPVSPTPTTPPTRTPTPTP